LRTLTETYAMAENAVPLEAPGWFDCFDADASGEGLEAARCLAFMGTENIRYGIDRIVASPRRARLCLAPDQCLRRGRV
jgi:hypothetical protein